MNTTYISTTYSIPSGIQQSVSTGDTEIETVKRHIPVGEGNALSARLITVAGLGWADTNTNLRRFRRVVNILREGGTPVTATIKGYYRARTQSEFDIGESNKAANAFALLAETQRAKRRKYIFEQ